MDRIFTYTSSTDGLQSTLECQEAWPKCLSNIAEVSEAEGLSDTEKIWLIVFCVLIILVLLVITYMVYRIIKQKREPRNEKSMQTVRYDSGYSEKRSEKQMVIDIESDPSPQLVSAAQIFVTNAAIRPTTRDRGPLQLKEKLFDLIKCRDEDKLGAFLETISDYYDGEIDKETVDDAKEILKAWKTESELQKFCCKTDHHMNSWQLTGMQNTVLAAEESVHRNQINSIYVKQAKQLLEAEVARHKMVKELKKRMSLAMQDNDLEELDTLVDVIRAKQLDGQFEQELKYAQNQFDEQHKAEVIGIQGGLSSAMESRDSGSLREAITRAETSGHGDKVNKEVEEAQQVLAELKEEGKLIGIHKLKMTNAINSGDTDRMEDVLQNMAGNEELKTEIGDLEMALKRKYLQKRLQGNLNMNVAVQFIQGLDLVRLRRAIQEATAAGFLKELGLELDQSEGLLSKLERMELIKKSVMELTNGHIAEIKSYSAPPVQVHKVLMSLLIVLGENPGVVRDWREIQTILVKTGKMSLKRRVQDYLPANLSTGNAKRAANIISGITSQELNGISRAAKVFYLWTSSVVEERLSMDGGEFA